MSFNPRPLMRLAIVFGCLVLSSVAWGQWRTNQRSHQMSILPKNSTLRLCRDFTDQSRLKSLLKPLMVPRIVDTQQHRQVGEYIHKFFVDLGWHTEWDQFQEKTPYGVKTFRNLIVTNDEKAPRRLVLACHYDSKILPGQVNIAATDSAVPCAMMMDVAQTISPYMYKRVNQNIGLQMVFLDGEEAFVDWTETDSLYGARHLAAKWEAKWYPSTSGTDFELSRELDRIDAFMLLDLLGAPNPRISNTVGHGANQLFRQFATIENELKQLGCLSSVIRNVFNPNLSYNAVEDDHIPFMKRGVPILHLITVPFPRIWHTARDDGSALHYPTIDHLTAIVRVFVAKYLGIAPA